MEEDEALAHTIELEQKALRGVERELLKVEEDVRVLLKEKTRLDADKAARISKLDDLMSRKRAAAGRNGPSG